MRRPSPISLALLALLALPLACAAPVEKTGWEPTDAGRSTLPTAAVAGAMDDHLPTGGDPLHPPPASLYGEPPGARRLATYEGADMPLPADGPELPPALWLPAAPAAFRAEVERGERGGELDVLGRDEADLDGDGRDELVLLVRPVPGGPEEPPEFALLLGLTRDGVVHRLFASRLFTPLRHAAPGGPTRTCHAEWRLAGKLRRQGRALPIVFEERGVGCAVMQDGGFDRLVTAVELRPGATASVAGVVARARLRPAGAAELYDGVAWASDVDGDGSEELVVRGIALGLRPCGSPLDPPFWIEELGARVLAPGAPPRLWSSVGLVPLASEALPEDRAEKHVAACGPIGPAARGATGRMPVQ